MATKTTAAAAVGALGLALGVLASTGCRGRDVEFDCDYSGDIFDEAKAQDGELRDELADRGPYPAAMLLSAEGINKLLGSSVDDDVPFTGVVPFGPTTIAFEPDGDPVIEIGKVSGCSNCILYSIDFLVQLGLDDTDFSTGTGNAKLEIPMILELGEGGSTKLIAAYDEAHMNQFEVTVYGLDSDEYKGMAEAISILMEANVKEQFGPTELLQFDPLSLGDGDVQLAARELETFPEANTLALWLATNMVLPSGSGLDIQPELPEGLPMGLQFSTALLLGMERRMLVEGNVPRYYDRDGNPDDDGEFAITIEDVEGVEGGDARLDTIFRVWRLSGGFCGYAEADLPLYVEVDEERENLRIVPGTVEVLRGKGIGSLAAEEDSVVKDNQHLLDNFRGAVAKHMGLTVNYESLSIPEKVIYFFTKDVEVTSDSLRSGLDFVVVAAP